jgi:hypothetical protein
MTSDNPLFKGETLDRITFDSTLTKRERFAIAAMQGLCANRDFQLLCEHLPVMAISQADALIAALKSTPEPK